MKKIPLLLLPGMMCDARLWLPQIQALSDVCEPVGVADIGSADSVQQIAQHVLQQAPKKFALAGLSMGGIIALEIWRQASHRITHMALLDTNARAEKPERQILRQGEIDRAKNGNLRELVINELKPNYLAEANKRNHNVLNTVLGMALSLGVDVFENQSLALRDRPDSSETLATINCPALVLCGIEDQLCPLEYHQFMANEIPDAKLQILEECGHLSTLEQPEKVSQAMREWLAA